MKTSKRLPLLRVLWSYLLGAGLTLGVSLTAQASNFGSSGYGGSGGYSGSDGYSGPDQTLFLDGRPLSFQLSGGDGDYGHNGSDGSDASSCYFYGGPSNDMYGANGGDGGDGGSGGDGGHGGDITAYYKNLEDLRQIYVISRGGRGAEGGGGGRGGRGCDCPRYSWSVRNCYPESAPEGHPREVCHENVYHCHPGSRGRDGRHGSHGGRGSKGLLTILKLDKPLPPDAPYLRPRLVEMPDHVFALSLHKWFTRPGAKSLLAPGSDMEDTYREYDQTLHRQFVLRWEATRPVENFNNSIDLSIGEKEVQASYPKDWWIDLEKKTEGPLTTHVVKGVVTQKEAENVHFGDLTGSKQDLVLEVRDDGGVADTVATSFKVTYERKQVLWYKHVWTGNVPSEMVTRKGNSFMIALGKLPIAKNYLLRGKKVKIVLTINRAFAGREAKWTVFRKYKI